MALGPIIASIGVLISVLAVAVLSMIPGTGHPKAPPMRIQCDLSALDVRQEDLDAILKEHCTDVTLLTTRSLRFGELLSLTWRVHLHKPNGAAELVAALSRIEGVERALAGSDSEPSDATV